MLQITYEEAKGSIIIIFEENSVFFLKKGIITEIYISFRFQEMKGIRLCNCPS